ncbi:MAG: class A beta-lactamase-related serine hydrolase, partial [Sphingobacteriaceae bacterium]
MMRLFFLPALLLLFSMYSCKTDSVNKTRLDSLFTALNAHEQNMGSITIADRGRIVYQNAFGYSWVNGDRKTLANVKTKYRIGSITKMFTAVMIFQLIEEGKLTLNTTLAKYYTQLPNAGKITVGEMLSHRSGLFNFTSDSLYLKYSVRPMSEAEMTGIFAKQKPSFAPDLKSEYSNTNFVLLGYIIEKITGKRYSEELKKRITSRLGLNDTYYGTKADPLKNEAYSFNYISKWNQLPETDMSVPAAAGAIISTPTDLVNFIDALFADKLISHKNLEHMETMKDNFGMGMFAFYFDDQKGYGHTGGIDGFVSELIYFPADKLSIAYISNGVRYSTDVILRDALSIYHNKPFVRPEFKTVTLKSTDLDKYLGNYTSTKMPLRIAITKSNTTLMGKVAGGSPYPLEAQGNGRFVLNRIG